MVQLNILSGKRAGVQSAARRFPFHVGRAPRNELQLDDDGVWDQHFTLEFGRQKGFQLTAAANALTAINGEPVQSVRLHSGDVITLGSVKIQFWIAAARQRSLRWRETFVWVLLSAAVAAQFVLIYRLLR